MVAGAGATATAGRGPRAAARPLVRVRGSIGGVAALAPDRPGAWFACDVELDAPEMDLVPRVRAAVPDALRVEPHDAPAQDAPVAAAEADDAAGRSDPYAAWYRRRDPRIPGAEAAARGQAHAGAAADAEP